MICGHASIGTRTNTVFICLAVRLTKKIYEDKIFKRN